VARGGGTSGGGRVGELSVADLCALAYVVMLETLERMAMVVIGSKMTARLSGVDVEVPNWYQIRVDFDQALAVEPERVDVGKLAMLEAIGLR
jgi:hypothetical protein